VVDKYRQSAAIVNSGLQELVALCVPGEIAVRL